VKVLVTGGSGFVGRVVVPALEAAGHTVRLALRSPSSDVSNSSVIVGEIGPGTEWSTALEGVDAVVHLAARVHVMRDTSGGADAFERTNVAGTLRLASAAAECGARRFVFLSSIKVNGEATFGLPFRADDAPNPQDAYARSKLAAENGLRSFANLDPVIIRPPLIHGPGAKGNLARLCALARKGVPVPFGCMHNRRDLLGVENLASLIERCLWNSSAVGKVLLASDGYPLSTQELYRSISEAVGRKARVFPVPVPILGATARAFGFGAEIDRLTQSLEVDQSHTRETLDWSPAVSAASGISAMARALGRV
jgi:nucleoside-diphosphate-sugar epimerase